MLHITPGERDTLRLLAIGAARETIAKHLGMSSADVEVLICALLVRMGGVSETEAIAAARRRGLVDASYTAVVRPV